MAKSKGSDRDVTPAQSGGTWLRRSDSGGFVPKSASSRKASTGATTTHIKKSAKVRSGRAHIAGRRITVDDIVIMHLRLGESIAEIVAKHDLSYADVHAALAYYYDHKGDIDDAIERDNAIIDAFKRDNPSKLQEKLKALRHG